MTSYLPSRCNLGISGVRLGEYSTTSRKKKQLDSPHYFESFKHGKHRARRARRQRPSSLHLQSSGSGL